MRMLRSERKMGYRRKLRILQRCLERTIDCEGGTPIPLRCPMVSQMTVKEL